MNQDWEEKRLLFGRESNSEMTKSHASDICLFQIKMSFSLIWFNFSKKKEYKSFFFSLSVQCI